MVLEVTDNQVQAIISVDTNMFGIRYSGRRIATQLPVIQRLSLKSFPSKSIIRPFSSKRASREDAPRIRYLFYMFLFSSGLLYVVGRKIEKKQPRMSFSEKEFQEYEEETGLKRRLKLISNENSEKYKFYVIPYVHLESTVDQIAAKLKSNEIKIIDPAKLIEREKNDDSRKYSFLIQDLVSNKKPFPKGLMTALIKEDLYDFINSTKGIYNTNIIIKNYPQTTEDAIKFENDISDVQKCIELHYDILNELPKEKSPRDVRSINNVIGYFQTVDKVKRIAKEHDEMDDKLKEIVLEDY
ncbi:uncharacterized protein PRCAT00003894001 [Priceomyces carsonii]|uniref:uncharacterized protein n=1 Tax=Priceomyces carsonii TaxID=28549 RepID=UPI002EDA127A|nr:unnamed protein product [Priceomyces carsonii]